MNSFSKLVAYLLLAVLVMTFSPQRCLADLYDLVPVSDWDGELTNGYDGTVGGLYTQDGWTSDYGLTKIKWVIINQGAYLTYNYEFSVPVDPGKELSHIIFEVSGDFTLDDYLSGVPTGQEEEGEFLTFYDDSNGNPDMPAGFWGIKFEITSDEVLVETISFNTTRLPMWGNFYAKDGSIDGVNAIAYNTGLAVTDGAFIPVPDTVVPVPGAVLLGILGLGVAGIKLRKFA